MHNFKKSFGQNFLKSSKFPEKLVKSLNLSADDTVIEVGPGDGAVTKRLLDRGIKVISIEVDYDLLSNLLKRFHGQPNFELVHESILEVNIPELLKKYNATDNVKVTGSLPYNISKQIIDIFSNLAYSMQQEAISSTASYKLKAASFIVQEEVAKEYTASSPKATFLSNYLRIFADVRKLESIPAAQFFPRPKVNGGILNIKFKENIPSHYRELIKFIKIGFSAPRKTLYGNLRNSGKYDKEKLAQLFSELNLSMTIRPAEITLDMWGELYAKLAV